MIKISNDLDEVYSQGLIETVRGYKCSVCNKDYKQYKSAQKHIDKRECHRLSDIFADTPFECTLYKFYKDLCAFRGIHAVGLSRFRKKSDYTRLAKFCQFCIEHDLHTIYQYAEWLIYTFKKEKNPYVALSIGQDVNVLHKFKIFLREHEHLIDNNTFFEHNQELLETDVTFAIQSVLSGKIGQKYLFNHIDMDRFLSNVTPVEELLLDEFLSLNEKS